MLTLNKNGNKLIAQVSSSKKSDKTNIYVKNVFNKDAPAELDSTDKVKSKIFKDFLLNLKKPLSKDDITLLIKHHEDNTEPVDKALLKIFRSANDFLNDSMKRFLDYSPEDDKDDVQIIPRIEESYALFCSGASGAGKSYFLSQLIKANPPKGDGGIFIIGPFKDDESYKSISKNLIHLDLNTFEEEYGVPFTIECFPKGSILIMDDIESMSNHKDIESIRDKLLSVRRHYDLTMLCVNHISMAGASTKKMLLECNYYVCYPKANWKHCEKLLKTYVGLDNEKINLIKNQNTRWCFICKAFPLYFITQTSIGLL